MAKNPKMGNAHVNAQADALNAVYNGGKRRFYGGTQPDDCDSPTSEPVLVEFILPTPCFGVAVDGVVIANPIDDVVAVASGTASWSRVVMADGVTGLQDGTVGVGVGNFDIAVDSTTIAQGVTQHVGAWAHTVPRG
jgi:hypothetical protein